MSQTSWLFRHLKFLLSLSPKSISVVALVVAVVYTLKNRKGPNLHPASSAERRNSKKGSVNLQFCYRLWPLLKIVIPTWKSKEVAYLISLSFLLVWRTFMSISISDVKGKIVKAIVKRDLGKFIETVTFT